LRLLFASEHDRPLRSTFRRLCCGPV
jgi:hypothetical protein